MNKKEKLNDEKKERTDYVKKGFKLFDNVAKVVGDNSKVFFDEAKKFTEDLLVLDQKDLDLSNVAEEARQYIAAILTGVVIRHFVEAIAFERGHSLDVRRYMWQMEY